MAARKVCAEPGCPQLQPCPLHARKPWQRDAPRSTLSGSRQQKRARFVLLRDDGRCHVCGDYGADEADHVIPVAEGGADDVSNMAAIHGGSDSCHSRKTAAEAERARRRT
jgi:5-methylcytosine-specific restriction protein A